MGSMWARSDIVHSVQVNATACYSRRHAGFDHSGVPLVRVAVTGATGVFFTGGDQMRITTVVGGSRVNNNLNPDFQLGYTR